MLKILIVTLLLFTFQANANNSFSRAKVSKIIIHDGGYVLIMLGGDVATTESCDSKAYLVLDPANRFFDQMYSSILASYHADTYISGWVNGCNSRFKTPILTRLDLTK